VSSARHPAAAPRDLLSFPTRRSSDLGALAARVLEVAPNHALDDLLVLGRERLEVDALRIHAAREAAVEIEHVGEAAAHAGREVPPGRTEHHHAPARHVLAAVVTDALDHRLRTAVAH